MKKDAKWNSYVSLVTFKANIFEIQRWREYKSTKGKKRKAEHRQGGEDMPE